MVEMTGGEWHPESPCCHSESPSPVIPNAERDLIVMAVERQGAKEEI